MSGFSSWLTELASHFDLSAFLPTAFFGSLPAWIVILLFMPLAIALLFACIKVILLI